MESTVLRKPEATSPAVVIDVAVVSSVRREEFRDRSKAWRTASWLSVKYSLSSLATAPLQKDSSPYGSVGYNRNPSRVSAHAPKRSGTHFTLKRSM